MPPLNIPDAFPIDTLSEPALRVPCVPLVCHVSRHTHDASDHYEMLKTLLAMEMKCSAQEADQYIRHCEVDGKVDYDRILAFMQS